MHSSDVKNITCAPSQPQAPKLEQSFQFCVENPQPQDSHPRTLCAKQSKSALHFNSQSTRWTCGLMIQHGSEVFRAAVSQLSTTSSNMVRILSNQLGNLKLKNVPGEKMCLKGWMALKHLDCRRTTSRLWPPSLPPLVLALHSSLLQCKFTQQLLQGRTPSQSNAW